MIKQVAAFSITKLRNIILVILVLSVSIYTAIMFSLATRLSERFGPQVRADLEWRVQRGAQELARASDIGLAIGDRAVVRQAFGAYAKSKDVQAIVAINAHGQVIARHGQLPKVSLFDGPEGKVRSAPGYLLSWAPAQIEGTTVGKVAVVVSTRRLREARELLDRSSNTTLTGGLGALFLGTLVVTFFTGAVALRDAQLQDYAKNLERKVDERTRELDERNRGMRLVLDNVVQGFITIDLSGKMASERSAIVNRWFGAAAPDATLVDYLEPHAPDFTQMLEFGLSEMRSGMLPLALQLYQLPKRFTSHERTFESNYIPIGTQQRPDRLLVILSDVTEAVAHERSEREQKELVAVFQRVAHDRTGVEEFFGESALLVGALREEQDPIVQQRIAHTLKGNCAMYGLSSYAELAHQAEDELMEYRKPLDTPQRLALVDAWKRTIGRVGWLLRGARRNSVQLDFHEVDALIARVQAGAGTGEVVAALQDWKREPAQRRLDRLGNQVTALAERLHKPIPKVEIEDHGVRLDSDNLAPFWTALVHVVRNAVDHGIESPETRIARGKRANGTIYLETERSGEKLIVSVRDDGGGVDWEKLREKAAALGYPHATQDDLLEALFRDGVSTKDVATEVSGRGVGLAAIRQVVRELRGAIEVESLPQRGTVFRFLLDEPRSGEGLVNTFRRPRASLMPTLS